jgi:hypothetical protein
MAKTVKVNAVIVNNVNPTVSALKRAMRQQASIHRRMLNTDVTSPDSSRSRKFKLVYINGVKVKRFI